MSTICTYTNFINSASKLSNKMGSENLTKIKPQSKKKSNFQSSKYVRMIMNSESQAQVRNIISKLKNEAANASNCEDADITISRIRKTIEKANSKITKLSLEQAMKKKKRQLEAQRNHHEAKKMDRKIKIRKSTRKSGHCMEVYNAIKEDVENENSVLYNKYDDSSKAFEGQHLDVKIDDKIVSDTSSGKSQSENDSVDIVV